MKVFCDIPLTRGKSALIDEEDFGLVGQFKWFATPCRNTFYAFRNVIVGNGCKRLQRMHTLITGFSLVDHRNGNGLDNRRNNLREATDFLNHGNKRKRVGTSSMYKGVGWHKVAKKWQAGITVDYKRQHLGLFVDEGDAARAYDDVARRVFGEFAALNFPENHEQSAFRDA